MDQLNPRGHKDYYRDLATTFAEIAELKQLGRQTRRHPPEQIDHLVNLLKAYGFVTPILVDHEKRVSLRRFLPNMSVIGGLAEVTRTPVKVTRMTLIG